MQRQFRQIRSDEGNIVDVIVIRQEELDTHPTTHVTTEVRYEKRLMRSGDEVYAAMLYFFTPGQNKPNYTEWYVIGSYDRWLAKNAVETAILHGGAVQKRTV